MTFFPLPTRSLSLTHSLIFSLFLLFPSSPFHFSTVWYVLCAERDDFSEDEEEEWKNKNTTEKINIFIHSLNLLESLIPL
jgi:hypothetical protein